MTVRSNVHPVHGRDAEGPSRRVADAPAEPPTRSARRLGRLRDDDGDLDRRRLLGYARVVAAWAVAGPAVAVAALVGLAALAPAVGALAAPAVALAAWIGLLLLTGPNGRAKFHGETAHHRRARLSLFVAGLAVGSTALTVAVV